MEGGERAPFLLDERGLPLFYPTLFATVHLRNAKRAVNTIRNRLADILVLHRWEADNGRDLVSEFSEGRFLEMPDIISLRDFAKLDMREHKTQKTKRKAKTVRLIEGDVGRNIQSAVVSGEHQFARMTTFADYLKFVALVLTQHRNSARDAKAIDRMSNLIKQNRPKGLGRHEDDDPHGKSPPTEVVDKLIGIVDVNDPDNPFLDPGVRLRNAIIFGLLNVTGMRRGELLSLRIDQLDFGDEPSVWVRRNQDDPVDPRTNQPATKTKERPLPLT